MLVWPTPLCSGPPGSQCRPVVVGLSSSSCVGCNKLHGMPGTVSLLIAGGAVTPACAQGRAWSSSHEGAGTGTWGQQLHRHPQPHQHFHHLPCHQLSPFLPLLVLGLVQTSLQSFLVPHQHEPSGAEKQGLGLNPTILPMALMKPPPSFLGALLPKHLQGAPSPDELGGLHQCPTSPLESFSCMCVETFCLRDEAKSRPW